jgi:hypothetical protein
MVSMVQACLLPQDGNVLPIVDGQNPPKKNRPPRILLDQVYPDQDAKISTQPNCTNFQVAAIDPDGDNIASEWFIDPNDKFTATSNTQNGALVTSPFGLTSMTSPLLLPRANGQPHILTLVISDGTFISPGQPIFEPGAPDGGEWCDPTSCSGIVTSAHRTYTDGGVLPDGGLVTLIDPSYTDSFTWIVTDDHSSCP